jgi:hypothetical protein
MLLNNTCHTGAEQDSRMLATDGTLVQPTGEKNEYQYRAYR